MAFMSLKPRTAKVLPSLAEDADGYGLSHDSPGAGRREGYAGRDRLTVRCVDVT
jgi:hypothetical protein